MGKRQFQAAIDGSREIGFTIISMTVSLVAVFIAVLFMGGIVGRLLREFAVVISVAILVSGVVSLTLTPMLGSRFLRHTASESHGRLFQWSERQFDRLLSGYERTLHWAMRGRLVTLLVSFGVMAVTAWLFVRIPKGFFPTEDTGFLSASTEASQDTSFRADDEVSTGSYRHHLEKSIYRRLSILSRRWTGRRRINTGRVFIRLSTANTGPEPRRSCSNYAGSFRV